MFRHLFKNFWSSFTKNILQVLGFFMMLGIVLTIFCGMTMSSNLSKSQIKLIGKDLFSTTISAKFVDTSFKISSSDENLSYGLTNINYESKDQVTIDHGKSNNAFFKIAQIGTNEYTMTIDSNLNNVGRWLGSKSSNSYFKRELAAKNEVVIKFRNDVLVQSGFFITQLEFEELQGYMINSNEAVPFVSSADNANLKVLPIFISNYKNFSLNQSRIFDLEIKLLNTMIYGSIVDKGLMSETMEIFDIFRTERYYIQSDRSYYWTTPIMVKGTYNSFLNYDSSKDLPPILINSSYASHNNINVNDVFKIYNVEYRVLGFATNAYVNTGESMGSFVYNPYLWIRGDDFDQLKRQMTGLEKVLDTKFVILGQVASNNLNGDLLTYEDSWNNMATVYEENNFVYRPKNYKPINNMYILASTKENIIWSLISAISLLLIISSFIMVSMIVNKLLRANREIIGNLKAQGYSTGLISTMLLSCFMFLILLISILSMISSWCFSLVLNITYRGFLELTTYISVPGILDVVYVFVVPMLAICFYAFMFIIVETSKSPLILMQPKVLKTKVPSGKFWSNGFMRINFKHKISFKFALDAKWKLLLTIMVTSLTGAMLFTSLTTVINFSQIDINLNAKTNWKYIYQFDNNYNYDANNQAPYDYIVYDSVEDVKNSQTVGVDVLTNKPIATSEIVLKRYSLFNNTAACGPEQVLASLKYRWINADSYKWFVANCIGTKYYDTITTFVNGSTYQYVIDELARNNGIITLGYQPIIYGSKQEELFAINGNINAGRALNYDEIQRFLKEYQIANNVSPTNLSIPNFYSNFVKSSTSKGDFDVLLGRDIEFLDYKDGSEVFQPKLKTNLKLSWFFNEITSFDDSNDQTTLLSVARENKFQSKVNDAILQTKEFKELIHQTNWFNLPNKDDYEVNVYPILTNTSYQYLFNNNVGDIYSTVFRNNSVNIYVLVDQFDNGMKKTMLSNRYNNAKLIEKSLAVIYSSLEKNFTYTYLGFYEKTNNYQINTARAVNYNPAPIYNGTQNLMALIKQTTNLQIILFLIYLLILIASISACIFQIFIITNIILKDNLKVLNSFKALGYSDFWIFNRMFLIYLPIILISWLISIPIGQIVIELIRYQIILNMSAYVSATDNVGNYLISFIGLFIMFVAAFVLNKRFMNRRYPILKTMSWS